MQGSELVLQAMTNFCAPLGVHGEDPVRVGADIGEINTALYSAIGILAALWEAGRAPVGEAISTSLLGTLLHMRSITWAAQTDPDEWTGFHLEGEFWPPATAYKTADGQAYFTLHRGSSEDWDRLLIGLDMLDVMDDPRFGDYGRGATGTGASDPGVKARFEEAFASKPTSDLLSLLRSVGSNAVAFNDYPHLFDDEHVKALGLGTLRMSNGLHALASPWMGDVEPGQDEMVEHLRVPGLGEHTVSVLEALGVSAEERAETGGERNDLLGRRLGLFLRGRAPLRDVSSSSTSSKATSTGMSTLMSSFSMPTRLVRNLGPSEVRMTATLYGMSSAKDS